MARVEAALWRRVQHGLGAAVKAADGRLERIENGVTEGMPDVNGTVFGIELWVELKNRPEVPLRQSTRVLGDKYGLRPEQINWHLRHARAGGRSWVLAGVGKELWLANGRWAKDINEWSLADWAERGIKVTGWKQLLSLLCQGDAVECQPCEER